MRYRITYISSANLGSLALGLSLGGSGMAKESIIQ